MNSKGFVDMTATQLPHYQTTGDIEKARIDLTMRNFDYIFERAGVDLNTVLLEASKLEHLRARLALKKMRMSTDSFESLDLALLARACRERARRLHEQAEVALKIAL